MSDGPFVAVRDLSERNPTEPDRPDRNGELVSSSPDWLDLRLTDGGPAFSVGVLIEVQGSQTVYVGHVESAESLGNGQRLRVRVDHWLALQDVSLIQKLWTENQSG
jgi:hypothetical protein